MTYPMWTIKQNPDDTWNVLDPSGTMRLLDESYSVAASVVWNCNHPTRMASGEECAEIACALLTGQM